MGNRSVKLLFVALCVTGVLLLEIGAPVPGLGEEFRIGAVSANVNLRKAPSLQGDIITGLLQGSLVEIYEEKSGWYRVSARKYHQVFNGWVSREYVEIAAGETTAARPATAEPEPDHQMQSLPPAGEPVQSAPIALPEKPLPKPAEKSSPPEEKAPAVLPEPEPVKPAAAAPQKTKIAATKTARLPRVEKAPAADAGAEPADDLQLLLPTVLPVLAVIVLLIVAIVYGVKRLSSPKADQPESLAEPAPAVWPLPVADDSPVAENGLALEENELIEADPLADFEFQMEPALEDRNSGAEGGSLPEVVSASDDGDSPTKGVFVYDLVMEKINRMSDVELSELLDLVDDQLKEKVQKDDRLTFYTTVDYVVDDQYYRDFIQDLSVGGVFVKTRQMFEPGQHILMTFMSPYLKKPFNISGEIVHTVDTGIDVKFGKESQAQAEAISALMDQIRLVAESG